MSHMSPEARYAFHDKAQKAVLAKMRRVYGITNLGEKLMNQIEPHRNDTLEQLLKEYGRYETTRDRAMFESDAVELMKNPQPLDDAAKDVFWRYQKAFMVRKQVKGANGTDMPPYYRNYYTDASRDQIIDAYVNHLSNMAEAKFQMLGLTPLSAHILHGNLILQAHNFCSDVGQNFTMGYVNPQLGSISKAPTDDLKQDRLDQMENYWRTQRDQLQSRQRNAKYFLSY